MGIQEIFTNKKRINYAKDGRISTQGDFKKRS